MGTSTPKVVKMIAQKNLKVTQKASILQTFGVQVRTGATEQTEQGTNINKATVLRLLSAGVGGILLLQLSSSYCGSS